MLKALKLSLKRRKMETKIIDNFIKDRDLFSFLKKYFLFKQPHYYGHGSFPISFDEKYESSWSKCFYDSPLSLENPLNFFLARKMGIQWKEKCEIKEFYINVQHVGMEGEFHVDKSDVTGVLMMRGKGDFELKDGGIIEFVENRLILFDSHKLHRGHAPRHRDHSPRITVAIKLNSGKNES